MSERLTIDEATGEVLTSEDIDGPVYNDHNPKYELIEYEGKECRHYPGSGAIQEISTGRFLANTGGRPGMDSGIASEMATTRWTGVREAIIRGLSDAATELNVGHVPQDMLAEVVKARAITAASSSGKAGNDAARFIFSVVGTLDEGGKAASAAMEVQMSPEMAKYIIDKMIEDK